MFLESSKDLISKRRPVTAIKNKVIEEQKPKPKVKYAKYGYFISREILVNRSKGILLQNYSLLILLNSYWKDN